MTELPESRPPPISQRAAPQRLGLVQIHIATLFFGGAGLFGKLLDVNPAAITAGRTLFGSLALLAACWFTRTHLPIRSGRDLALFVAAGAVLALHWCTFFAAVQTATVAIGLLAFASFPMFVTLLEPIVFGERLTRSDVLSAVTVVAGLLLLAGSFDVSDKVTQGVGWGILSGLTFAVYSLLSRGNIRAYPQLTVTLYQQAFACWFAAPLAISSNSVMTARTIWLLAILGTVFTAAPHALFVGGLKFIRARSASIIVSLEPVYGVVLAALVLGEIPTLRTLGGGVLVLGAAIALTLRMAQGGTSAAQDWDVS
jgi:drug/metabolite transporter (DMT)-like permease